MAWRAAVALLFPLPLLDDGDGDRDVVLATDSGEEVHANDGAGRFALVPFAMPAIQPFLSSLDAADLDQDGDLDVVTGGTVNRVYINDGSGFFTESSLLWLQPSVPAVWNIHLADVNGDDRPDLLGTTNRGVLVLWNHGDFDLGPNLGLATADGVPGSIDADGDGDAEIVVATAADASHRLFATSRQRIYEQTVTDIAQLPTLQGPVYQSLTTDLNGDGAPDLVVSTGSGVALLVNDGQARFADETLRLGAVSAGQVAAGDLDGDGDTDVLTREVTKGFALSNLYRQIDVPLSPKPGGSLQVDVYMADGRSGATRGAFPLVATQLTAPVPLGSLGFWQLHPSALLLPAIGVNGASALASYAIPNVVGFYAIDLYVQALLAPTPNPATWRLSNLVKRELR